jgi:N-acetylneuraminate lyase
MPELFLKLEEMVRGGENKKASELQAAINEIIITLCGGHGSLYAMMKEVLKMREGIDLCGVRAPLANVVPEDLPIIERGRDLIDRAIRGFC